MLELSQVYWAPKMSFIRDRPLHQWETKNWPEATPEWCGQESLVGPVVLEATSSPWPSQ